MKTQRRKSSVCLLKEVLTKQYIESERKRRARQTNSVIKYYLSKTLNSFVSIPSELGVDLQLAIREFVSTAKHVMQFDELKDITVTEITLPPITTFQGQYELRVCLNTMVADVANTVQPLRDRCAPLLNSIANLLDGLYTEYPDLRPLRAQASGGHDSGAESGGPTDHSSPLI